MSEENTVKPSDFIRETVAADLGSGKHEKVITRFPPEPNGYLHIGHAKSICLNFGIAVEKNGECHLRFDDTNPEKEEIEYIESIKEDVKWLGFRWGGKEYYASDYFDQLYDYAIDLIRQGKAYVDSQSAEEMRINRGTLTEPGKASPYRERTIDENLSLFERMKNGEFDEGVHVLRLKIDLASPNINLRDPVIYRIKKVHHHRTGDKWCIYPMYDYTHCISDSIESITHSICTLEFEDHRPLYDWVLDELKTPCHPQQIEFARLNLSYTVMSKRKLLTLVRNGVVDGWDDPRMPTISGLRRRGVPPEALRDFCDRIGIAKRDSMVDMALFEHCIREDLNERAPRAMAVLKPLKIVIENYPEGQTEKFDAQNHPLYPERGTHKVSFSREVYIEQDDFMENPVKGFHRLAPGKEVRLRYAYIVKCKEIEKDAGTGEVTAIKCVYDPETKGGNTPDGRKIKGTIHWVSASECAFAEVRLYDRLFTVENPEADKEKEFLDFINPESLTVLRNCPVELSIAEAEPGTRFQFERQGYFCADSKDSKAGAPVFNRITGLRDSWAKASGK